MGSGGSGKLPTMGKVGARRCALLAAAAVAFGLGLWSCLDPTEIKLEITTDVPCTTLADNGGVAISVGPPGDDSVAPTAVASKCETEDGGVGSLVVVPSADIADDVGIRVVL